MAPNTVSVPSFSSTIIEEARPDGYWIETFLFSQNDKAPGLIASGLASGVVEFLDNPIATGASRNNGKTPMAYAGPWMKYEIGKFNGPVAAIAVDVSGNGRTDVVICHEYGATMLDCDPDGGWVTWLENPGRDRLSDGPWKRRNIGRWPAMHRLRAGHFTQRSFLEIIGAPVVRGPHDKTTPVPIIRYVRPTNVFDATEWQSSVIDDDNFTVIHEIVPKKLHGPHGLDSLLVASREGLSWLYYEDSKWRHERLGTGEPWAPWQSATSESPGTGDHWGTGAVDAGRVGDDPFAYLATMDPFHGVAVAVYTKTDRGLTGCKWKRQVLDVYGTPNQNQRKGDGPGHFVLCGDFDGDGDDEFLVSLMGPLDRDEQGDALPATAGDNPNKGIMYYKAVDLEKGVFAKFRVAVESSARLAVGDFGGDGKVDIASISYSVPQYYEEPNPTVTLHLNDFATPHKEINKRAIVPSVWDGEGMVYFAEPSTISEMSSAPLIEVANYAISVELWPPRARVPVHDDEGVKVLYGSLTDSHGTRRPLGGAPFPSVAPLKSVDPCLAADAAKGAVVLRFKPVAQASEPGWEDLRFGRAEWSSAAEVPVRTTFDASSAGLEMPSKRFVKVEDTWWGGGFKGVEFYNLTGFHFRFLESKENLAHMQFWVAGPEVNCGTHNHSNDYFQEIHVGLSLGTQTGGMSQIKPKYDGLPLDDINALPESAYTHAAVPSLCEHGGLWHRDSYGGAVRGRNNVVSYPWHKWQAGGGEGVDVWLALEFNPDLSL